MPDSPGTLRMLGQLSTVGMSFVLALVLGFGAGYWLDGWLGTRPWLSFLGFFMGLGPRAHRPPRLAGDHRPGGRRAARMGPEGTPRV
jgi:hypothetical protein